SPDKHLASPVGTTDAGVSRVEFSRPYGTGVFSLLFCPAPRCWATFIRSLRDEPAFATESARADFAPSQPSVSTGTHKDPFGITELFPTRAGGREWLAHWETRRTIPPY